MPELVYNGPLTSVSVRFVSTARSLTLPKGEAQEVSDDEAADLGTHPDFEIVKPTKTTKKEG